MASVYKWLLWVFPLLFIQSLYDYIRNWNILRNSLFIELTLSYLVSLCMQNSTMGLWERKHDEDFCILEEFDFLNYGLAYRKECILKAYWVDGWILYIYLSPRFKRMHICVFIISHSINIGICSFVLNGPCWPHTIWGIWHLWNSFFGTQFGEASGVCKSMSILS